MSTNINVIIFYKYLSLYYKDMFTILLASNNTTHYYRRKIWLFWKKRLIFAKSIDIGLDLER